MIKLLFIIVLTAFSSCTSTIDVERQIRAQAERGNVADPTTLITAVPIEVDPQPPLIIERPIFIPQEDFAQAPAAQALTGTPAVRAALSNVVQPQDFVNSAMVFDFDRDFVFEIFTQPFRVTNIVLQAGEQVIGAPFISDSERWMLGAGVSRENGIDVQHIYIKPTVAGLHATLIINTDRRVYHLLVRSFNTIHMPIVRWRYPTGTTLPQDFIHTVNRMGMAGGAFDGRVAQAGAEAYFVDPNFLSFDYIIRMPFFRRPAWAPRLVYDDGRRTYIVFPEGVLMRELPVVFENRQDVVNFRVNRNIIIIDKLIEHLTVRLGNQVVTIEKRRSRR